MKYCQKCKVMLKDEVEICPICGYAQKPEEEWKAEEQKKQKRVKTAVIAVAAIFAAVIVFFAACMILGKEPENAAMDETYTTVVEDEQLTAQFEAYVITILPMVWAEDPEILDSDIEYYTKNNFPGVAAGLEQIKELAPVAGSLTESELKSVLKSEEGYYKLSGVMVCENAKVNFDFFISASGYIDAISFELREETFPQKVREKVLECLSE